MKIRLNRSTLDQLVIAREEYVGFECGNIEINKSEAYGDGEDLAKGKKR